MKKGDLEDEKFIYFTCLFTNCHDIVNNCYYLDFHNKTNILPFHEASIKEIDTKNIFLLKIAHTVISMT